MGAFKLVEDERVDFYELLTISEENSTLVLRIKHFHRDLKGWEESDEVVTFRLVNVSRNKVFFDGFTFEKVSDDEINIYVQLKRDGEVREQAFAYSRVGK